MPKKKKTQQTVVVPHPEEKPTPVDLTQRQVREGCRCSCGGYIHHIQDESGPVSICGDCNYMWSAEYEGYRYLRPKENLSNDERYIE